VSDAITQRLKDRREALKAEIETYRAQKQIGDKIARFLTDVWDSGGEDAFVMALTLIEPKAAEIYEKLSGR